MLPLLAVGAMGAGAVMNHMGARRAAKQQAAALAAFQAEQKRIMEGKAKDQWQTGRAGQKALGEYLGLLSGTMGAPGTDAPRTEDFQPAGATDGMNTEQLAAYRAAMAPKARVDDANLETAQRALDRGALSAALQGNSYNTMIPVRGRQTQSRRNQFRYDTQLADAQARLAGFQPSNSTRNLQLLGSLLGTAGQAGLMFSAMGGAGPGTVAPGGAGLVGSAGSSTTVGMGGAMAY